MVTYDFSIENFLQNKRKFCVEVDSKYMNDAYKCTDAYDHIITIFNVETKEVTVFVCFAGMWQMHEQCNCLSSLLSATRVLFSTNQAYHLTTFQQVDNKLNKI